MKKYFFIIVTFFIITVPQLVDAQVKVPPGSLVGLPDGGQNKISTIIVSASKFVVGIIGALAILMIMVSGILYLTSGGDSQRIDTAKKWLIYSIVGLVVALLAYAIISSIVVILSTA